jgi:hypothetical protein
VLYNAFTFYRMTGVGGVLVFGFFGGFFFGFCFFAVFAWPDCATGHWWKFLEGVSFLSCFFSVLFSFFTQGNKVSLFIHFIRIL